MAGLIPDERCFVLASYILFLLMKTEHAISWTSAATDKVMEPHSNLGSVPAHVFLSSVGKNYSEIVLWVKIILLRSYLRFSQVLKRSAAIKDWRLFNF